VPRRAIYAIGVGGALVAVAIAWIVLSADRIPKDLAWLSESGANEVPASQIPRDKGVKYTGHRYMLDGRGTLNPDGSTFPDASSNATGIITSEVGDTAMSSSIDGVAHIRRSGQTRRAEKAVDWGYVLKDGAILMRKDAFLNPPRGLRAESCFLVQEFNDEFLAIVLQEEKNHRVLFSETNGCCAGLIGSRAVVNGHTVERKEDGWYYGEHKIVGAGRERASKPSRNVAAVTERRDRIADLEEAVRKLSDDLDVRDRQLSACEAKAISLAALKEENARIAEELEEAKSAATKLAGELSDKEKFLRRLESNALRLTENVRQLSDRWQQAVKERDAARDESTAVARVTIKDRGRLSAIEEELRNAQRVCRALEEENELLRRMIAAQPSRPVERQRPRLDAVILSVRDNLVVLSAGRVDGLGEGMELIVSRGSMTIARIVVKKVYEDMAGAEVVHVEEGCKIAQGDMVQCSGPRKASDSTGRGKETSRVEGHIVSVDSPGTVFIDLGRRDGVGAGKEFRVCGVQKGGRRVEKGRVRVVVVDETFSRAEVIENSGGAEAPTVGDVIEDDG